MVSASLEVEDVLCSNRPVVQLFKVFKIWLYFLSQNYLLGIRIILAQKYKEIYIFNGESTNDQTIWISHMKFFRMALFYSEKSVNHWNVNKKNNIHAKKRNGKNFTLFFRPKCELDLFFGYPMTKPIAFITDCSVILI